MKPIPISVQLYSVGDGSIDGHAVIGAVPDTTEWLVVELDECATATMAAIEKRYRPLVSNGFARGRK